MGVLQENQWENQEKFRFPGVGVLEVPEIMGTQDTVDCLVRFCDRKAVEAPESCGLHFFYDDFKFKAMWKSPDKYIDVLKKYKAVISPDFSLYTDFPAAVQMYAHFRRQWLGAYWQLHGVNVIPDVVWGDEESYSWCFDGLPKHSTVCVSSVGVARDPAWKKAGGLWEKGYAEMMRRLEPSTVLIYGVVPEGSTGNIIRIPSFYEQRRAELGTRNQQDGQNKNPVKG